MDGRFEEWMLTKQLVDRKIEGLEDEPNPGLHPIQCSNVRPCLVETQKCFAKESS